MRTLSGQAPVTKRSGKQCHVTDGWLAISGWRMLSITGHGWPASTIRKPARLCALRSGGHSHGQALRGVGDRLLYVLCTMLERQTLFNPDHKSAPTAMAA